MARCGIFEKLLRRKRVVVWVMGGVGDGCGATGSGKSWDVGFWLVFGIGCGERGG